MAQNPISKDSPDLSIDLLTRGRRSKVKPLKFAEQKGSLGRTSRKTPEVMVKVSGGGRTVKQVYNHLTYLTRNGDLEALTENGEKLSSREEMRELLDDWDLESTRGYGRAKLTHNLVFSMPKGTDAKKLHSAVKEFARKEFWDRHQYLMVLHEDKDHPHVHIAVKAQSKDTKHRIYIKKETLEFWRQQFAEKLREHGIEANATPREIRGNSMKGKQIGLYYAEKAGRSRVLKSKIVEVANSLKEAPDKIKPWELAIKERRKYIVKLYHSAARKVRESGDQELADSIDTFAASLPPIVTERDLIGARLTEYIKQGRAAEQDRKAKDNTKKVGHVQLSKNDLRGSTGEVDSGASSSSGRVKSKPKDRDEPVK